MKRLCKVFLSLLLSALMLVSALPMMAFRAEAATNPSTVTVSQATSRLNDLANKFVGKYFTVSGNACASTSEHQCSNCLLSSVVSASWVQNLTGMGSLDSSLFPAQYYTDGAKYGPNGWSCFSFANFAHWYVFAQKNTDNLVSTLEFNGACNYSNVSSYARPGDVIRSSSLGHSMILVSYDSNGMTVLDCNWGRNTYGGCYVQKHYLTYSEFGNIAITGVQNYDRTAGHTHSYGTNYEADHPHRVYAKCSCGDTYYTGETKKITGCELCYPPTYSVTYNANGGTGAPAAQTKTKNVNLTLSATIPAREGYNFINWRSDSGNTYAPGGIFAENKNTTLTAVWEIIDYGELESIEVASLPNKISYDYGEVFDETGLTLTGHYSSGLTKTITSGFAVSELDTTKFGKKVLTVSYGGYTTNIEVDVTLSNSYGKWILASELPDSVKNAPKGTYEFEYTDAYRSKVKSTVTNGRTSMDGWNLESSKKVSTSNGGWSLSAPSTSNTQGDTYHTVVRAESKVVYDSYAWVNANTNWFWKDNSNGQYTHLIHVYSSVSLPNSGYSKESDGSYLCDKTLGVNNPGKLGTVYLMTNHGSSISSFTVSWSCFYLWPNGTTTIYRSVTDKYQYTHSKWSDWSDYTVTPITPSSTVEAEVVGDGFVRYRLADEKVSEAETVVELINTLPATVDHEDDAAIRRMEDVYDALSDEQKALISNAIKAKLEEAITAADELKADLYVAETVERTCTTDGYTLIACSSCDYTTVTDALPALGHDFSEFVKTEAPTCTAAGYTVYKCANCELTEEKDPVAKIGHNYTTTVVAPSPAGQGYTLHTCLNCNDSYKDNYTNYVFDENAPCITVGSKNAKAGQSVTLDVVLENNPGMWGMDLVVEYDKTQLTLTGVTNGTVFSDSEWVKGNLSGEKYILSYEANEIENITNNGVVATLEFTVNEGATVDSLAAVTVSYKMGDIINIDFEDIGVAVVSGGVNIVDFIYGDLNSDGAVNKKDSLLLKMYLAGSTTDIDTDAADVFTDGIVNKKDSLLLKRYLAGNDVVLGS